MYAEFPYDEHQLSELGNGLSAEGVCRTASCERNEEKLLFYLGLVNIDLIQEQEKLVCSSCNTEVQLRQIGFKNCYYDVAASEIEGFTKTWRGRVDGVFELVRDLNLIEGAFDIMEIKTKKIEREEDKLQLVPRCVMCNMYVTVLEGIQLPCHHIVHRYCAIYDIKPICVLCDDILLRI